MSELKVKVLDNDAAIVSGQLELRNGKYKMADGKLMDLSGKYRFIDTFARRNGDWQLVAGISTKITALPVSAASPAAAPATGPRRQLPGNEAFAGGFPGKESQPVAAPTVRVAIT